MECFNNISVMDRSQLILKLLLLDSRRNVRFALMTTHLESLPQYKKQRLDQLKQCFDKCLDFPQNYNVIFGGDLNLEENEVCFFLLFILCMHAFLWNLKSNL